MPERFVFRQVCSRDFATFLADGEIRAKNHYNPQRVHPTSYRNLVDTRGTALFAPPHGGVVNDYVPFYFSPLTSFTYAIHIGKVELRCPDDNVLGTATDDERIFFACAVDSFANSTLSYCFSDLALNTAAPMPSLESDLSKLEGHINWELFDEGPTAAYVPEIGYQGVCRYFKSTDTPQRYHLRHRQRMAEFLVKDAVPLSMVTCVIAKSQNMKQNLQAIMDASRWNIPILVKPGCYF